MTDVKKPEFLDLIQIDPKVFNKSQREKQDELRSKEGDEAYRKIMWSDKHHPLKSTRSRDFRLTEEEISKLQQCGVVFKHLEKDGKKSEDSFARLLLDIYNNDLPVVVTSDCMLYALHKFYDTFLKNVEQNELTAKFEKMCDAMLETLYTVTPTEANLEYLKQLEIFFMIPKVVLMLKNQMRSNHVIEENVYTLFSIEECKKLLENPSEERIENEEQAGFKVSEERIPYEERERKISDFLKFVKGNTNQSRADMYYAESYYHKSPKLNTAVNAFRKADVDKPLTFRFGGKTTFADLFAKISNYNSSSEIEFDFCGVTMKMDATQFKPRGHYTETLALQKYFIAFTWLSKFVVSIDRKKEQITKCVVLSSLMAKLAEKNINLINEFQNFIGQIVGESDGYNTQEFLGLINKFIPSCSTLTETFEWILKNDEQLTEKIFEQPEQLKRTKLTKFGDKYEKSGDVVTNTEMTSIAFSIIGKGNQIDNIVTQKLVDNDLELDDPSDNMKPDRKFPSIFDLLYSVFGNTSVLSDIERRMKNLELHQRDGYVYSNYLEKLKEFVEYHSFDKTLYAQELKMLRALNADKRVAQEKGLFPFNTSEWERKQAQTQIGHYTELRHDNVLYVDEACGGGCECSYPDLIVEPVPTFWREMLELVKRMKSLLGPKKVSNEDNWYRQDLSDHQVLDNFETILNKFLKYLESQMNGTPDKALRDELTCIVKITFQGSGPTQYGGWYMSLFHNDDIAFEQKPEVCSMFTGVDDERGPGGIVHLGTGYPQIMYLLTKNANDPNDVGKVFIGPTYEVYEVVTAAENRMNDDDWERKHVELSPIKF